MSSRSFIHLLFLFSLIVCIGCITYYKNSPFRYRMSNAVEETPELEKDKYMDIMNLKSDVKLQKLKRNNKKDTANLRVALSNTEHETNDTEEFRSKYKHRFRGCGLSSNNLPLIACPTMSRQNYLVCISSNQLCDTVAHCPKAEDESPVMCMTYLALRDQMDRLYQQSENHVRNPILHQHIYNSYRH